MLAISALLVALSVPVTSSASEPALPRPAWQIAVSVSSGTPAVLPGLTIGAVAAVSRRLFSGPFFLSGRVEWASASAANESWTIDHRQVVLAGGGGVGTRFGVGQLWAQVGAGVMGLEEILGRHQLERIQMTGVPGGTQTSLAMGPYGFAEVGVAVRMRGAVSARVTGGPILSRIALVGGPLWRLGISTQIGVSYEF